MYKTKEGFDIQSIYKKNFKFSYKITGSQPYYNISKIILEYFSDGDKFFSEESEASEEVIKKSDEINLDNVTEIYLLKKLQTHTKIYTLQSLLLYHITGKYTEMRDQIINDTNLTIVPNKILIFFNNPIILEKMFQQTYQPIKLSWWLQNKLEIQEVDNFLDRKPNPFEYCFYLNYINTFKHIIGIIQNKVFITLEDQENNFVDWSHEWFFVQALKCKNQIYILNLITSNTKAVNNLNYGQKLKFLKDYLKGSDNIKSLEKKEYNNIFVTKEGKIYIQR